MEGWLDCVPEMEVAGHKTKWDMCRRDQFEYDGTHVEPLVLEAGSYLLHSLRKVGPTLNDGWGQRPLEYRDLVPYAQATGDIEEPWEFDALVVMSRFYLRGLRDDSPLSTTPPHERERGP